MSASGDSSDDGPDLTAGIPASSLPEGAVVAGHVGENDVLVTRSGGALYAIGATCTHYGGPLAEGLVIGDTIRCPWHHACFSLRTGEPLRAPALDSVPCFRVEERDRQVFVGERINPRSLLARGVDPTVRRVVIVGAGAAGVAACEMLRRCGYAGSIHLIDELGTLPVDRPNLSKDFLAGTAQEEWVDLRPESFYTNNHIELVRNTRVSHIDVDGCSVTADDGRAFPYDRLLLATGSTPVKLSIRGSDAPHVHYLRELDDCKAIIAAAQQGKRAVIIGASFIGLEVAASLRKRDVAVSVVAPESVPLVRALGRELGAMIRNVHAEHGVQFHLGKQVARIDRDYVHLNDGAALPADFVVIGIGVKPNLDLARSAGLEVADGVIVDERLQTSAPGIFAAGDIAAWPDPHAGRIRVEHWVVAERHGQTAARNMLGAHVSFMLTPFFWTAHYDTIVNYVGHAMSEGTREVSGNPFAGDCTVIYRDRNGVLSAEADVGRDKASLWAEARMDGEA